MSFLSLSAALSGSFSMSRLCFVRRALLLVLLALLSRVALADPPSAWRWKPPPYDGSVPWYSDASAACNSLDSSANDYTAVATTGLGGYQCKSVRYGDGYVAYTSLAAKQVCADGSAPNTSLPLAQQCPVQCQAGVKNTVTMDYGVVGADFGKWAPLPNVWNGCKVKVDDVQKCQMFLDNRHTVCWYTVENTGAVAAPGGVSGGANMPSTGSTSQQMPPTKSDDPSNCPGGSVQAGSDKDGIPICIGTGTSPDTSKSSSTTTAPSTTVSNADGSTTKTQTTTASNPDGSTTTTKTVTTTGADGTVTVNTSSSTGSTPSGGQGQPGRNGADGKDGMSMCQEHPELTICRNSAVSGDCMGGFSCVGDAIQCATLRAAAQIQCKQQQTEDDLKASGQYTLGSAVASGADPAASTLPSPSKATTVTVPGTLDQTGWLSGGQCFADKAVTVQGRTFVLPYSKACDYLVVLRLGLMVIASLVSFRIIRDAVLT